MNVWEAARDPDLERYCDLLARGTGQLTLSLDGARESADAADRILPGHAAPSVLRGRAYASANDYGKACVEFERARAIDDRSLEDPSTLREYARGLARTDRGPEALSAYRALGSRLYLLPSIEVRARTHLEAAELALSLGPSSLDEAVAFLREAKQMGVRELEWRAGTELSLALDRSGLKDEAAGLVAELARQQRKGKRPSRPYAHPEEQAGAAFALSGGGSESGPAGGDFYRPQRPA